MRFRKGGRACVAAVGALALVLAACGGDAEEDAADEPTSETETDEEAEADGASADFDPDNEEDAINSSELESSLGEVPQLDEPVQLGGVVKFLGNQYWQLLAEGMADAGEELGVTIDVQAAESEADALGQMQTMETMIAQGYEGFLVSPQTDTNLLPAVETAEGQDLIVVNVNDAVLPSATQWVGPNQYENGVRAAEYFLENLPDGSEVAVIEGQAGVYAAVQRTRGFTETLEGTSLEIVASVPGDWDVQLANDAATTILEQYPDIGGFYANNDGMALGVVEAVASAGRADQTMVIGTDGVEAAYDSIRSGGLTATVDSFPYITGEVAVEVMARLLEGQEVPRAVFTPQNLITSENVDNPEPDLS